MGDIGAAFAGRDGERETAADQAEHTARRIADRIERRARLVRLQLAAGEHVCRNGGGVKLASPRARRSHALAAMWAWSFQFICRSRTRSPRRRISRASKQFGQSLLTDRVRSILASGATDPHISAEFGMQRGDCPAAANHRAKQWYFQSPVNRLFVATGGSANMRDGLGAHKIVQSQVWLTARLRRSSTTCSTGAFCGTSSRAPGYLRKTLPSATCTVWSPVIWPSRSRMADGNRAWSIF